MDKSNYPTQEEISDTALIYAGVKLVLLFALILLPYNLAVNLSYGVLVYSTLIILIHIISHLAYLIMEEKDKKHIFLDKKTKLYVITSNIITVVTLFQIYLLGFGTYPIILMIFGTIIAVAILFRKESFKS